MPRLVRLPLEVTGAEYVRAALASAEESCQHDGRNSIRGKRWEMRCAKLNCAMQCWQTPSVSASFRGDEGNTVIPSIIRQKALYKLLLVGYKRSGTSTIFKQAKINYNVPFSEEERQSIKSLIQSNLYAYLVILLKGRERFEEEILMERRRNLSDHSANSANTVHIDDKTIYSIGPRLKNFSDRLLQYMASGNLESILPAATREYSHYVEELWKDATIQATYSRRSELELLPMVATYFLDRAVKITKTDYKPSDTDMLYAEGITLSKGLSYMEFSYPRLMEYESDALMYKHDPSLRYQLIRVDPRILGGNCCKWLERFEDVQIVLFCVSLTDYAEFSPDSNGVPINKMMASKQLFTHPTFEDKKFLLFLNKFDMLGKKIQEVPLTSCEWFNDFNPVISTNLCSSPLDHCAFQYIGAKFKSLYRSLTDRKLYVSLVTGLVPDNVDEALRYAREILKWDEEEINFIEDYETSSCYSVSDDDFS